MTDQAQQGTTGQGDHPRFEVLTTSVSAVTLDQAVATVGRWVEARQPHYVNHCTSDTTLHAYRNPALAHILAGAGLALPDGMPLVWLGHLRRLPIGRCYGPDLMLALCKYGQDRHYRHFFYGATEQVLASLLARLRDRFPSLIVAGTLAPPYRALTEDEEREHARIINDARPDVVWVGLGTPKQDLWVARFRPRLEAPVLIAVGAAFDFHAGRIRQAPRWMMRCGLEWLFRLSREPGRLWRRYVIGIPVFLALLLRQHTIGLPRRQHQG